MFSICMYKMLIKYLLEIVVDICDFCVALILITFFPLKKYKELL